MGNAFQHGFSLRQLTVLRLCGGATN